MNIKKGDIVVLQMDDELIIVDSVDNEDQTFMVLDSQKSEAGVVMDFYHEYDIGDVMTIYRQVN
jgi:hypothetical protein